MPYELLAGVVPVPGGWLVASGKLIGISLFPEVPTTVGTLQEVLDHIPEFSVIALAAPIALPDEPTRGGRNCDRLARGLLGWPRRNAILSAPCRAAVEASRYDEAARHNGGRLDAVTWRMREHLLEVAREMQPYLQRSVYEVHPELSFYQLNRDRPLTYPKRTRPGREERRALLDARLPNAERVLDAEVKGVKPWHLLDACAALWTARRIFSRSVSRLPVDPEWNGEGLRMEIMR